MQHWIYYDSKTGNVDRFVHKLEARTGWSIRRISENLSISQPGHLITFTTGRGEVPVVTDKFMQQNHDLIKTVSASGNKNWGLNYGRAADTVAAIYQLPVLFKFELSGSTDDVQQFINKINEYHEYHSNKECEHS
ncbi:MULTISPECIES: class Ib ribonucleoside-diphosphate reductase assembly flavoprotein NrdI [Olivibacter]|jgi:protein involved in ribonucleotide reduction|uniref:NrdI protein n=3 Tax=Sphingobacteriaceae TaxID=84566 RepID=F4C1V9_SPHS2|nr:MULTISPECIES: class Ib ribonucleoside-diphosphate reductase assembly flavoprotein NrdI [Olivibacter]MCL4639803.1 class Ib ribonucleoside-diphosphate reductase assembly flavoprotein NrdI [Olivibacter sp. UJ_SKK_5.1]MDM8174702.1 class Ib ribonucleoside-diphosphate reductase assembly flavoprotein NrdI [Olivibacter sp. 47]MDX3913544.1 class Ib ribonucleoside-diphosphate reductase assembly flavoprotein NrdI [Pseudosphingobacterium sp.]QEL01493.1 class Ib ribonucleoside-diphosphate reductase assem